MLPCVCSVIDQRGRQNDCGKNISDTLSCASCATFLFLPHFDVICDLLLNRRMATWNQYLLSIQMTENDTNSLYRDNGMRHAETFSVESQISFNTLLVINNNNNN